MKRLIVCTHYRANPDQPSCGARGGEQIACQLERMIQARGLPLAVERFDCLGRCAQGPNARLAPAGSFLQALDPATLEMTLETIAQFCDTH